MTYTVGVLVTADAKSAKAELAATAAEAKKLGATTGSAGKEARGAAGGVGALGAASGAAAAKATALANAEAAAGANALEMGQNHRIAAGQVGNLTAQFNDIGMMLAAGQNPLQLAIQQGTQITQVIGPMGARGAVSALSSAFLGMLNPVSLITIGSIAAGAAMIQWLTGAGEKVPTLQEAVDDLASAVDAYEAASKRATTSTADLRREFGAASTDAQKMFQEIADADLRAAERAVRAAADALQVSLQINATRPEIGDQGRLADLFDLSLWSKDARGEINGVLSAFRALEQAQGLAAQVAAAQTLQARIKDVAEATNGISAAEDDVLKKLSEQILSSQRLIALRNAAAVAAAEENGRAPGFEAAKAALDYRLEEQRLVQQANADAAAMIATLQSEAAVRLQILLFGQDSELVSQNRLAVERDALATQMETEGVAADVAARLLEAWDAAKGFNGEAVGMSGYLSSASAEAAAMAGNIWNAVTAMAAVRNSANAQLAQMSVEFSPGGQALKNYGSRAVGGTTAQNSLEFRNRPPTVRATSSGGGRGGGGSRATGTSEVEKQQKALDELIKREERELELLRESDPIRKELLRNRDAMAGATDAERAKVEELITTRIRETEAMETMQWVSQQAGSTLIDALMGGANAGEQLIDTLKRAVLQAALLGEGPLSGLFGGKGLFGGEGLFGGLGDFFGGLGGGATLGAGSTFGGIYATGGMVHGPGSGTSDDITAKLSNGEFVMNARSTARYRHQLEAMNSGSPFPAFAAGGFVGGGGTPSIQSGDSMAVTVDMRGAQGDATIEDKAYKAMKAALAEWDRKVLPRRMQDLRRDPRRIG